jgi:bifunctional non-homologous end joining protein LigD
MQMQAEQEFVISGYTDPRGSRSGFGALLLGYYRGRKLVYAGKVGTEFDQDLIRRLGEKLARLETPVSPFAEDGLPRRGVHWVKPKLIAQIGFTEWTGEASCDTLDSSACGMTSGRKILCLRADVR